MRFLGQPFPFGIIEESFPVSLRLFAVFMPDHVDQGVLTFRQIKVCPVTDIFDAVFHKQLSGMVAKPIIECVLFSFVTRIGP